MTNDDIFDEPIEKRPSHPDSTLVLREVPNVEQWGRERIELLKRTIAKNASDDELSLFIEVCKRTQLDPFARQIYAIKRWDASVGREVMAAQCSIDGFRLVAQRSGEYEGQTGPFWCDENGEWTDVWLKATPPVAAKVGVWRKGFREPIISVARFDAYKQSKKDGSVTLMWKKMGDLMVAKCAEALALRRAFPQELSGLYTSEEMGQAEVVTDPKREDAKAPEPGPEEPVLDPNLKWKQWCAIQIKGNRPAFVELLGAHGFSKPEEVVDRNAQKAIFKEWNGEQEAQ